MDRKKLALEQASLIKQLQTRIVELEAELATLKKNSSNSSKPPSFDITKPPRQSLSQGKKRKGGVQRGHKRNLRKPFEENHVDKFVELDLKSCPTCGGKLVLSTEPPKIHQQVEHVEKPCVVTDSRQGGYGCEHCQCHHAAELPKNVAQAGLFGPKLISPTASLNGRGHLSYKTVRDFFADALSLKVSTGFLAKQVRKVADTMEEPYQKLLNRLPKEPHLHVDETGNKESGEKRWTWCFRSPEWTVFHVDPSRGSVVLENLLGLDYAGIISCDFCGAYRKFARLTSTEFQFCGTHLIREVKFLAESKDKATARYGNWILKKIRKMFSTIHRRDELSDRTWRQQMQAHRESILKVTWGTIPQNKDAINIAQRLWNWKAESCRFIDEKIPTTNNLGEQTIRKVVIDRKVTQGTRSDWGNRWLERALDLRTTRHQRNVVPDVLCRIVSSWSCSSGAPRRLILLFSRNVATVQDQWP